jgi:hypothetical protein
MVPEGAVRRRLLLVAALVAVAAAAAPGAALALDECRGLKECVPVVGPWVVVPAPQGARLASADWELRCPVAGYVVGGVDSRVTDRGVDVSVRGESGSPVAPGVTTRRSIVFTGRSAGRSGSTPTAFKPAIGGIPLQGGGGRAQTSVGAPSAVYKPGAPFTREIAAARLIPGRTRVVTSTCPVGLRVVDGGHAIAFRTAAPPSAGLVGAVATTQRIGSTTVRVSARLGSGTPRTVPVLVQVFAVCARGGS